MSGSTAAIRFAHHGCDVTLMEKAVFPREKICGCCLGAAGLAALDAIDVGDRVRELGTATHTFAAYLQTAGNHSRRGACHTATLPIRFPLVPGVAVSRATLDTFLIAQARSQDVQVLQPYEAQVIDSHPERTRVRYRRVGSAASLREPVSPAPWICTEEYHLVVLASGLSGVFAGGTRNRVPGENPTASPGTEVSVPGRAECWRLPWIESPHGPLGIATQLPATHPATKTWDLPDGEIQMVCGDEGYVGLVRLPGGAIDVAAALRSQKQAPPLQRTATGDARRRSTPRRRCDTARRLLELLHSHPNATEAICDSIDTWLNDPAHVMTAPPLRRRRHSGHGGVVAIGDCARYVEPMTGEGMTWGIESGLALADLWRQESLQANFVTHWNRRLPRLQRKRRRICSSVTVALRSSSVRRVTHFVLSGAPWLAKPITRGLAGGPHFSPTTLSPMCQPESSIVHQVRRQTDSGAS